MPDRRDPWHTHALRILWLTLVVVGAAAVKLKNPELMPVFLGLTAGGWALTRIVSEAVESFDALLEWLGETEERDSTPSPRGKGEPREPPEREK